MRINSFVPPHALQADQLELSAEESHHLARVLRVEAGQELTLFDGAGTLAEGEVETVTKKAITVRITARKTVAPPTVAVTLIQAVCKPDRFELILQKATELGVRFIQPVITRNASLPAVKIQKMIARGESIIRNATQQCGTAWMPNLRPIANINSLFPAGGDRPSTADAPANHLKKADVIFIGSLHPNAKPFREAFQALDKSVIQTATLLIGPEGDFTREEVDAAVAAGAIPVTFGDLILRTETAAIFGLSVLSYELS